MTDVFPGFDSIRPGQDGNLKHLIAEDGVYNLDLWDNHWSVTIHGRTFYDVPSLDWLAEAVKEKQEREAAAKLE